MEIETKNKGTVDKNKSKTKKPKKATPKKVDSVIYDVEGKLLLVRVGTRDEPATDTQITEIEDKMVDLLKKNNINCAVFVTHHAVAIDVIQ